MPLATLHLVALNPEKSIKAYLDSLRSLPDFRPLVVSRVVRWIIKPEKLDVSALLDQQWDLLLIFEKPSPLTQGHLSKEWLKTHYTLSIGVPGSIVKGFQERNQQLLHPQKGDVPALGDTLSKPRMVQSTQGLELNEELLEWSKSFESRGAVSMLNLLAFKPGKDAHDSYLKYGKGFAESAGAKRGGTANIVGKVVDDRGYQEAALAHYPTASHFADMLASDDYQEINHRFRLPAL